MNRQVTQRTPVEVDLGDVGIVAFESVHAYDFAAPPMRRTFYKLFVAVRGEGRVQLNTGHLLLTPETVVLVPPNSPHTLVDEPGRPLTLLGVCFTRGLLAGSTPTIREPVQVNDASTGPRSTRFLLRFMLYEQACRSDGWEMMLRGLIQQMVAALWRRRNTELTDQRPSAHEAVVDCIARLQFDFFNARQVSDAAAEAGLSRRRFTDLFRSHAGTSYRRYVESLRIQHARHLLASSDRTVISIAFECGFEDLSSFYRAFRRLEDTTPLGYRRSRSSLGND